jgi:hypothetical protein
MLNRAAIYPGLAECNRATRANQDFPDVATGAVGSLIADGTDGGQYAQTHAKAKSRRWRDGDSERDKASSVAAGVVQHPTR